MRALHPSRSSSAESTSPQRRAVDGIDHSRHVQDLSERPAKRWLRRVRGAFLMGVTWAVAWAPIGVLVGMIVDPDGSMDEMWPAIGAYPGFLSGVVFSVVLGIAARRRSLRELSLSRVGAWGALAGLLLGLVPFAVGEPTSERSLWLVGIVFVGSTTVLGALSAAASLAMARRSEP